MNSPNYFTDNSKISRWLSFKRTQYRKLIEFSRSRITYNTSIIPMPSLAWEIDPVQNRFIIFANKGIAIADTLDKKNLDATLLPEALFPRRGFVKDLSWFTNDNSLTATLFNSGTFNLIDMNNMAIVDSFDLNIPSLCIKFDRSGHFPFCVAIGTNSGLRFCDLKSGSQVQILKTKFGVGCIEYSSSNQHEIYTGLANGKILIWDIRKPICPIFELTQPNKRESPVTQITNSSLSSGSIISGYGNGDIASFCSSPSDISSWRHIADDHMRGSGKFVLTSYGEIINPVRGALLFINPFYGNLNFACENELLTSPSSIIMNRNNNDIFIFDSSHIGTIFRFKPQNLIEET